MSYKLSIPSPAIRQQASKILADAGLTESSPAREKAIAVFNFVRDEIRFGFTRQFDFATPEQTLQNWRGHCNPQSALFASLLNAVDVPAKQRFVELDNGVLHGIVSTPPKLLHSCVEVEGCCVDGFIASRELLEAGKEKLRKEGRTTGYGVAIDGSVDWNGKDDCFVQMTQGVGKELGSYDEPMLFLKSGENYQKLGLVGGLFMTLGAPFINANVDKITNEDGT